MEHIVIDLQGNSLPERLRLLATQLDEVNHGLDLTIEEIQASVLTPQRMALITALAGELLERLPLVQTHARSTLQALGYEDVAPSPSPPSSE